MECVLSVIVSTGLSGWWFSGMWASVLVLSVVYLRLNGIYILAAI